MQRLTSLLLLLVSFSSYGQDKTSYFAYNKLVEVLGTNYVLAQVDNYGKMAENGRSLLFIETKSGENREVSFPKDSYLEKVEQIKLDTLDINKFIVVGRTINLNSNKTIDWNDPRQIFVLSVDGKEKTQITEDRYFASSWVINRQTGTIVITGHYDSNNNGKYDRTDKGEVMVYDLKAMKATMKISD